MRLAVVTERVDLDADITGFTHRWWERLAARLEHLHVLAQGTGRTALPPNVTLHDLGKDRGAGAARRAWRLAAIVRRLGRGPERIDAVLAHMAPQYAILAWPPAALHGVPVLPWVPHGSVALRLRAAHALVTRVVPASRLSLRVPPRSGQPCRPVPSRPPRPQYPQCGGQGPRACRSAPPTARASLPPRRTPAAPAWRSPRTPPAA